jgi:hypothetical protein
MRALKAALAALIALLLLPSAAGAALSDGQAAAFDVSPPAAPLRDVVIERSTRASARVAGRRSLQRTPVNDGAGRSVEITTSPLCDPIISCHDADPTAIATFLGTLPHGDEMNLLNVDLEPAVELASTCGSEAAQACYFPIEDLMIINGNDTTAADGADRNFVIAHEYGHHLANHRDNPPFNPAIDFGPKYWASQMRVCQGVRSGALAPGDQGGRYRENPGEAFAEAFAFNHFPAAPVQWAWTPSLRPNAGAFSAIQQDALDPWTGRATERRRGRFASRRRRRVTKAFSTAQDGLLTLILAGPDRADMSLRLRNSDGRLLERSDGIGSHEQLSYTICGERSLRVVVKRRGVPKTRFRLRALRP